MVALAMVSAGLARWPDHNSPDSHTAMMGMEMG
jgi:hypothetical protein